MRDDQAHSRLSVIVAAAVAVTLGVAAVAVPRWRDALQPAAADVSVGWALLGVAVVLLARGAGRLAALLGAAGAIWTVVGLAAFLPGPLVDPAERLALVPHALLVVAVIALPTGRPASRGRWLLAGAAGAIAVAAGAGAFAFALLALGAVALAGAVASLLRSAAERADIVAVQAGLGAGLIAIDLAGRLSSPPAPTTLTAALAMVLIVPTAVIPAIVSSSVSAWPSLDGVDLDQGEALGLALGRALGTGALAVAFPVATGGGFIDSAGRAVTPPRDSTRVTGRAGELVAVLAPPALVEGAAAQPLLRLLEFAADGARLRAAVRERAHDLAASRRRLLRAGDAERQQLEQQLRQGAVARLDRVAAALDGLAATTGLAARATTTREELLRVARGLDPLGQGAGLHDALATLAEQSRLAVTLDVDIPTGVEPPEAAARAAWFTCAEALANAAKHAAGAAVAIEVVHRDERLTVRIADDGPGGAVSTGRGLSGLADRAAALGGSFDVQSDATGTRIHLDLPAAAGGSNRAGLPVDVAGLTPILAATVDS